MVINGLSGSAITKAEIFNLCSLSSGGYCANTYPWIYNTSYWSGSANGSTYVWDVYFDGQVSGGEYYWLNNNNYGARPIIQILVSAL